MSVTDSTTTSELVARAKEITERELAVYKERTKGSQAATERARKVLPAGVPSSFQAYDPHPIVVKHASGSHMVDVDGNTYVDYDMGFGALFAGHMHPAVRRAVEAQLDDGTLYVTPCELDAEVAELLGERYGLPMWRPTNSGTEATMDAIRLARGVTKREKLVKVEGGYHGHHDEVMISNKPAIADAGPADAPWSIPQSAGITQGTIDDVIVIPFNDAPALERALASREVACFIVEPVMENIGICLPDPGYLEAVREICTKYGTLLIFDEVKTGITAGLGGATEEARRHTRPDHARQVDRRRLPRRRVRRQGRVHEPDHHGRGAPPRHLQRQPTRDGRCQGDAHRGVHARGDRPRRSPSTIAWSRRVRRSSTMRAFLHTPSSSVRRAASRGRSNRCATTATTRPPTSTSRSPSGCTASIAASCSRRVSTSSG